MSAKKSRSRPKPEVSFDFACTRVESILQGTTRREILAELTASKSFRPALMQLGESLRANQFDAGSDRISLQRIVKQLDKRTRQDGFHVLNDWDGKAERFNDDTIPVEVQGFMLDKPVIDGSEKAVLGLLLDYYFLYVLALLALRAWDEGDANENLARITRALELLQGPDGSGHRFVDHAETLILVATSHFESDTSAYDRLLDKVKLLKPPHSTNVALAHAPILSCHLRFGFEANYGRDVGQMRNDNVLDYSWLCAALSTLVRDYGRMLDEGVRGAERERTVEAVLNGLTPDPRAFVGVPPAPLAAYQAELSAFGDLFRQYRDPLLKEFEQHRPSDEEYSPICFFFNFPHNLLKAMVVDALLRGEPWSTSLNDLLTGVPHDRALNDAKKARLSTLMTYARASPDTLAGRRVPVIVYDLRKGLRAFRDTIAKLAS